MMLPIAWEVPLDEPELWDAADLDLMRAGWRPDARGEWRDPASGRAVPRWRALDLMRRDSRSQADWADSSRVEGAR